MSQPPSTAAPTPGPWTLTKTSFNKLAGSWFIGVKNERTGFYDYVAEIRPINSVVKEQSEANAHLIAAAPETAVERDRLVEALDGLLSLPVAKRMLAQLDKGIGTNTPDNAWQIARAVLSEARKP